MTETRGERKERTRRAILDATLALSEESSLAALSLRQVAKEVGIVPTAFYRHFESVEALGLALVDESFVSLRSMLRDVRRHDAAAIVDASVEALVEHVSQQRAHFSFIARQRAGGPPAVRAAIAGEIDLIEHELATDLGRLLPADAWSVEDLRILAALLVGAMVNVAEDLSEMRKPGDPERIAGQARTQLNMVLTGAINWRSSP